MKRRITAYLVALGLMLALLTACGGGAAGNASSSETAVSNAAMDMPADLAWPEPEEAPAGAANGIVETDASQVDTARQDVKMILTASLELETTAFDEAVEGLNQLTERMDGYFENSTLRTGGSGYRWADYTIRVPAERFNDFLDQAGQLCHLTWRTQNQENVTEVYYDTAGRLKTQQIKLERLQALLARAELMEDIITIESAISETEYQIESLSGALRHYDALVDYATVTLNLQEVYRLSNVEEAPDSFAARMGSALSSGWAAFVSGMENFAVGLAYSWAHLLLLAVIVFVVFRVLRHRKNRFHLPKRDKTDDNAPKT